MVASRPHGEVELDNFRLEQVATPELNDGTFLIETLYLTISPPLRMWLTSGGLSGEPVPLGDTMRGNGLGRVLSSRHPEFNAGDLVTGALGWQEIVRSDGKREVPVRKVTAPDDLPLTTLLHVLGGSGPSAYFGFLELGKPKAGELVVVSAAAGTVGSLVCQLARKQGCRVIGIAGSPEKCQWLTDTLGCEAAIDYKRESVADSLAKLCPGGVDVYFDNVGGETLDAALGQIAQGARVVLCGGTSQYNNDLEWYGPRNYFNLVYRQATMAGFYVYNYLDRFEEALGPLREGLREGWLQYAEEVVPGLDQAPRQLKRVLNGENFGTVLVQVKA